MGHTPPPRPLTEKEFRERWRPSITLAELDPALDSWLQGQRRLNFWRQLALAVGIAGLVAMAARIFGA